VPSLEQPVVNARFIETLAMISRLLNDEPDVFMRGTRTDDTDGIGILSELTCLWEFVELVFNVRGEMRVQISGLEAAGRGRYLELRDKFAAIQGYCASLGVDCNPDARPRTDKLDAYFEREDGTTHHSTCDDEACTCETKAAPKIECTCGDHMHKPGLSPLSNLCCYTDCNCKAES
jgi:hypothetical protein